MKLFFVLFVFVFALIGLMYLLRDGYRIFRCRRYPAPKGDLILDAKNFPDARSIERAFLYLDAFFTRPEAKYLIGRVVVKNVTTRRIKEFHDAARGYDFSLACEPEPGFFRSPPACGAEPHSSD